MTKRLLAIMLALLMIVSLVACGKNNSSDDSSEKTITGYKDTINVGYLYDLDTADPYQSSSSQTAFFTNSTFRTITKADPQTGELVLVLAESVEDISSGNTCFQVKLKKGVKFHDGTELNAEDAKFTWEYAKNASNVVKPISSADIMVKSIDIIDEYTLNYNLNYAIPDFAYYLEYKIYSKEAFDTMSVAEAGVIGCGPYKCGQRISGVSYSMERFDDYYEGIENLHTKTITIKVLPDDNSLVTALQAGQVDYAFRIASSAIETLQNDKNLTCYTGAGKMSYYMGFKYLNNSIWNNHLLRKVIAMAINKEDIVAAQFNNGQGATVSTNFCIESGVGYTEVNDIKYNPVAAKELFNSLGYTSLDITIMIVDTYKTMAQVVQSNLSDIGINAKIKIVDGSNWPALKVSEDYDIDVGDYGTYSGAMLYNFDRFFSKNGSSNMRGFYSENFENLMGNCRSASNLEDMTEQFGIMQQWVADNVPFVPICVNTAFVCGNKDLCGVVVPGADNVLYLETLYIPIYE